MFFAVTEMYKVDEMFRYSLEEFMNTFTNAIERTLLKFGRHSVAKMVSTGKLAGKRISNPIVNQEEHVNTLLDIFS